MSSRLISTKVKVRNPAKLQAILNLYEFRGIEVKLEKEDSEWVLQMSYHDPDPESWDWPGALKIEEVPDEDDFPDWGAWYEAEMDLYNQKGNDGFLDLLRLLAAYILSPLQIVAVLVTRDFNLDHVAGVWRIAPGSTDVETLELERSF